MSARGGFDLSRALLDTRAGTYVACERDGGLPLGAGHPLGFFRDDARHLSGRELLVDGERPSVVASAEAPEGGVAVRLRCPRGDVELTRRVVGDGVVEERIRVAATATDPVALAVALDADFEPMLVLRGASPPLPPVAVRAERTPDGLELSGAGRDGVRRTTRVAARPAPAEADGRTLRFVARPGETVALRYALSDDGGPRPGAGARPLAGATFRSDDPALDAVLARSLADLDALACPRDGHLHLAAGVPWYVALFGRDALIAAMQAIAFAPAVAEGTVRLLAAAIGTRTDPAREEEPGKVAHELRSGELARVDATPLARYYGSVDATPLLLCALAAACRWTGSAALAADLRPQVGAALDWIGDRLLTYSAAPAGGLRHQAWKDSDDGLPGRDGRQPADPVAVVEAQGYAVAALRALAPLSDRPGELRARAARAAERLERFWLPDRRCYAMALDGAGAPLGSVGSNQGHLLWAGAVPPDRAAAIRDALLAPAMWSGWGVRTLAADEAAYDPRSYHRGSVWPHDTALFAAGLRAYGFDDAFARVAGGLIDAASALPAQRLPELLAGTAREAGGAPAAYASACRPQAWAAGTVPQLVTASLGLEPDGLARRLVVRRPLLPGRARDAELRGLPVAGARVDLRFRARAEGGRAEVEARVDGDLRVEIEG